MICSNKFMRSNYGKGLREFLAGQTTLLEIVDFGELPVFSEAATFPVIIITCKQPVKAQNFLYAPIKKLTFPSLHEEVSIVGAQLDGRAIRDGNWTLTNNKEQSILDKMQQVGIPLAKYTDGRVLRGVITGLTEAFVVDRSTRDRLVENDAKSTELIKPFAVGDDVRKYHINFQDRYLILIPKGWTQIKSKGALDAWEWFKKNYPAIASHLKPFAATAEKRLDKGEYWWELRACDYYDQFEQPKIIYPDIAKESRVAFDKDGLYLANTIYFIPSNDLYLLALLNSKLVFTYMRRSAAVLGDPDKRGRLRWFRQDVMRIPIRPIGLKNPTEKKLHDKLVALVEKMLELNKRLAPIRDTYSNESDDLKREVERTDKEIDNLVYDLYGLTEEERKIVEGEVAK